MDYHFDKYEKRLIDYLKKLNLNGSSILLFGSRARRDHSEGSDIDIAIDNLPETIKLSKIQEELDKLNLPYHIDLIDLNSVDQKFYNKCLQEAINIQDV
ncbi:MAG: nucleotidyltransferase domain-containing protein [Candidatus Melainabacteria bacterium]|jgi:predicted nucleotidyltransferase|nr:nucleotidyltransferase domain-containing protein [Candidatus Melainabacteria bacterium]